MTITPYYERPGVTVYHGDSIDVYPHFEDDSFDLLFLDPPYYKVKMDCEWDRQWDTAQAYLEWLAEHAKHWRRILADNGSLYVCASSQMVDSVKETLRQFFRVLNTIRWYKADGTFSRADVSRFRTYCETWEALIFCEQRGADDDYQGALIAENATYWDACDTAKRTIFGDYLRLEFGRAGVTNRQIATLFPSRTGGLTGCVSNWLLGHNCPTPEQYRVMRHYLNSHDHGHEYLRTEYEELRTEYEELRTEYEELRRPFCPTLQTFRDTWFYDQVESYEGKHPAEKPLTLLADVIRTSTREGAIIGDFFMGSGSMLRTADNLGRIAIGCDVSEHWCNYAVKRLAQMSLFAGIET